MAETAPSNCQQLQQRRRRRTEKKCYVANIFYSIFITFMNSWCISVCTTYVHLHAPNPKKHSLRVYSSVLRLPLRIIISFAIYHHSQLVAYTYIFAAPNSRLPTSLWALTGYVPTTERHERRVSCVLVAETEKHRKENYKLSGSHY